MYTEKVLDHFEHPRNVGALDDANGVGMVGNAKCGDIMQMFLKVNDDGIIEDVGFKTFGCGAAIQRLYRRFRLPVSIVLAATLVLCAWSAVK